MGRLSRWVLTVETGRCDYRKREDDAMIKAEALNMEEGTTSQGR